MHKCILLAKEALSKGNPLVGAILVVNDKVIGEGIEAGKSSDLQPYSMALTDNFRYPLPTY